MKKITKILLPIDFSDPSANAFRYALQLADHIGAEIEVLNAVYPEGQALDYPVLVAQATASRIEIVRQQLKKFVDTGLTALGQVLKNAPVISSDLEIGTPVQTICSIAKRDQIDLIIIGSRGQKKSGLEKILGSVGAGVVSVAHCPVMVIPEDAQMQTIRSLTYSTDVRNADPFEIWNTLEMLKPFNPSVNVIHVNFNKEGNSKAWGKLEKMKAFFKDRAPELEIHFHHEPGDSLEEELNAFVEKNKPDLLVMYQPPHNFWDRLFHKSATKKMALHTKVPLLILKG